jgi:bifunctional DNA-binding transcriptional regulator/antitoxin component of YhaV-PrlF toxin-antitoxin module
MKVKVKNMSWDNEQKKEIETIKERKITVRLSDADCDRLARKCGEYGLTIGELIENFVGDLVGGTYSNGSDERDYANKWFERCWFGMFPEETLLKFLLYTGYDVYDDFLEIIDDIENGYAELEDYKKDQSVFDEEEIEFLKTDIDDWEKQIAEIKSDYLKKNEKADWEKEVEKVNEWWKAKERLINE